MSIDSDTPSRLSRGFGRRQTDDRPDLRLLSQVETYWRSLIGEGQIPRRVDVDATRLDSALPYAMILERVAPGMARVRLAGHQLNEMFGMDARGMPLSVLVAPHSREALSAQLETMFAGPAIVEIPLQVTRGWGRKPLIARLLLLPLTDGTGACNRALAVIAAQGSLPAGGTHRFEIQPDGTFRCTLLPRPETRTTVTARPIVERRSTRSLRRKVAPPQMSLAPRPAPFSLLEGGKTAHRLRRAPVDEPRPALKIVVSNDL